MKTRLLAIGLVHVVVAASLAESHVSVWYHSSAYYLQQDNPPKVEIYGPGTYKIEVTDEASPDGLGWIQLISVTQPVSGTVEIYILRD
jgi:hypothetical protein